MAILACAEIFDPAEIVAVHLIGKMVRACYHHILVAMAGEVATRVFWQLPKRSIWKSWIG